VTLESPAVGEDRQTVKFPRSMQRGTKIPLRLKIGEEQCWEGVGWVVSAEITKSDDYPLATRVVRDDTGEFTEVIGGFRFLHAIHPSTVITDTDRPSLHGSNTKSPPTVPSGEVGVLAPGFLRLGARLKWDASRQIRQRIVNPDGIDFAPAHGPGEYIDYPNYPSGDVVGNDDESTRDEDNDPYTEPDIGKLRDDDTPNGIGYSTEGVVGNSFELRLHFREFSRLELDGNWYRISAYFPWRAHFRLRKLLEADPDGDGNPSDSTDINADNDTEDEVWVDNGSELALDNEDF